MTGANCWPSTKPVLVASKRVVAKRRAERVAIAKPPCFAGACGPGHGGASRSVGSTGLGPAIRPVANRTGHEKSTPQNGPVVPVLTAQYRTPNPALAKN